MKANKAKSAIDLAEEAFQLLTGSSWMTLTYYYIGALPFVLGALFFWSDMSRGAHAETRLAGETLLLCLLFFWMKTWQALFARRLREGIEGRSPQAFSWKQIARVAITQAAIQPSGLFLLPVAALFLFPLGYLYAFYQNVTALGGFDDERSLLSKGWKQACVWPLQNHYTLALFKLFGFFIFLNILIACIMIPQLLSSFFGIETVFVQSPFAFLNTTFFALVIALTYLAMDPVIKAAYVLRCFYGESRRTGEDLKTELRQYTGKGQMMQAAAIVLFTFCLCLGNPSARAAAEAPESVGVNAAELDKAVEQVLKQAEYTWRLPRERDANRAEQSKLALFLKDIWETIRGWFRKAGDWIKKVIDWFTRRESPGGSGGGSGFGGVGGLQLLVLVTLAVLAVLITLLILRTLRRRAGGTGEIEAHPVQLQPDLSQESLTADLLPGDEWMTLGKELLARGELRLALRAFYLASLAHLGRRNLVKIERFKSNREYEQELKRRAHAVPEVATLFSQNVTTFDRVWYGLHEVEPSLVEKFRSNVEVIAAG